MAYPFVTNDVGRADSYWKAARIRDFHSRTVDSPTWGGPMQLIYLVVPDGDEYIVRGFSPAALAEQT